MRNLTLAAEAGGPAIDPLSRPHCPQGKTMIPTKGPQTAIFFVLACFVLAVFVLTVFVLAARTKQLEQKQLEQKQLEQKQLGQKQLEQ